MGRGLSLMLVLLAAATAARASPYWIEYEPTGGLFPEEEGWTRFTRYGGAERSLEDGWLVLDGTASVGIQDYYVMPMDGALAPEPGELFILQWRLSVEQLTGYNDPSVAVNSDEGWAVGLKMSETEVVSSFEPEVSATFEPGIPHTFELRSYDMRSYTLSIDGVVAISGSFWLSLYQSDVRWGDGVFGGASLSRWDYVRFGVVPECSSLTLVVGLWAGGLAVRFKTGR